MGAAALFVKSPSGIENSPEQLGHAIRFLWTSGPIDQGGLSDGSGAHTQVDFAERDSLVLCNELLETLAHLALAFFDALDPGTGGVILAGEQVTFCQNQINGQTCDLAA